MKYPYGAYMVPGTITEPRDPTTFQYSPEGSADHWQTLTKHSTTQTKVPARYQSNLPPTHASTLALCTTSPPPWLRCWGGPTRPYHTGSRNGKLGIAQGIPEVCPP